MPRHIDRRARHRYARPVLFPSTRARKRITGFGRTKAVVSFTVATGESMAKRTETPAHRPLNLTAAQTLLGKAAPAIASAATHDAPLLLCGETGTGKGLAALAVHAQSSRRGQRFVVVNCASLTPTLAASTLFGHCRGAFTGADADQEGSFVAAHGGTLFLDEIGELPLAVQPQLLRALEAGVVAPLGRRNELAVDVRIVCATNVALPAAVHAGRFRGDLLERIADEFLTLPPLRQRRDELLALVATMQNQGNNAPPTHTPRRRILADAGVPLAGQPARVGQDLGAGGSPARARRSKSGAGKRTGVRDDGGGTGGDAGRTGCRGRSAPRFRADLAG